MKTYKASICGNFRHFMDVEAQDENSAWEIARKEFGELNCNSDIYANMWEVEEVEEITDDDKLQDQIMSINCQLHKYLEMKDIPNKERNKIHEKFNSILKIIDETKENMKEITNV